MRERVELCEGEIAIESTPGQGTRVKVRVPIPAVGREG
jgi:signal transduction histidine kinase